MTTGRINQISTRNLFFVFFPYRYRPKSRGAVGGKSRSHARRNGHTTLYTSSNVNPPSTPALAVSAFTVFPIVCPVWLGFFQYRFSRVCTCADCAGGTPVWSTTAFLPCAGRFPVETGATFARRVRCDDTNASTVRLIFACVSGPIGGSYPDCRGDRSRRRRVVQPLCRLYQVNREPWNEREIGPASACLLHSFTTASIPTAKIGSSLLP